MAPSLYAEHTPFPHSNAHGKGSAWLMRFHSRDRRANHSPSANSGRQHFLFILFLNYTLFSVQIFFNDAEF